MSPYFSDTDIKKKSLFGITESYHNQRWLLFQSVTFKGEMLKSIDFKSYWQKMTQLKITSKITS